MRVIHKVFPTKNSLDKSLNGLEKGDKRFTMNLTLE